MFQRAHHNAILKALNALDGDLLTKGEGYFGGGTAIVLSLGEYRESVGIDFLCASKTGYRTLRNAVWGVGLQGLVRDGASLEQLRDLRADQHGLRTALRVDDINLKFEIVRETRTELWGELNPA